MSSREFTFDDLPAVMEIHEKNGLDARCFPELVITDKDGNKIPNPLFVAKAVFEQEGKPALICFLKVTSELFFFIDHDIGTPEERWEWLQEFKEYMAIRAGMLGFDQMTAFVPTDIEKSFAKRLEDLGFVRSPWQSYTLNLG